MTKTNLIEIKVPGNHCPNCGRLIDLLTDIDGKEAEVQEGYYSICICCGEILRFDENIKSRLCTKADLKELKDADMDSYRKVLHAQKFIRKKRASGEWKK